MNWTHYECDTTSIAPGTSTPDRLDIRRRGQPENKEVAALQMAHHNPSDASSMTSMSAPNVGPTRTPPSAADSALVTAVRSVTVVVH